VGKDFTDWHQQDVNSRSVVQQVNMYDSFANVTALYLHPHVVWTEVFYFTIEISFCRRLLFEVARLKATFIAQKVGYRCNFRNLVQNLGAWKPPIL